MSVCESSDQSLLVSSGGVTDLSQWLHTLGSSGLSVHAAERKPRRASRSGTLVIIVVILLLLTSSCRGEEFSVKATGNSTEQL